MKILVLGENGMLGSQLMKTLSKNHEVFGTSSEKGYHIDTINDIWKFDNIFRTKNKPDVVINCIGIIKQKESTPEQQILINGLFPQEMAMICTDCGIRFIQISTDCVFSGKKGDYRYDDFRDATDVYGMTKALGEIKFGDHLTIRTSIIGHEKNTKYGLLEWFLHSEGKVSGYSNVWYSGVTTLELAKFINTEVLKYGYSGIVHFVGPKINKYDLLNLIKKVYNKEIEIEKNVDVKLDRSLKSMGLVGCSWEQMLRELREDHEGEI